MKILTPRVPLRRLGAVAALTVAFGAFTAAPALAHTRLVSSTPGKDATAGPVTEVKLVFSDKISLAQVVVRDGAKKTFQAGKAQTDGTTVTQKLTGALPAGSYTVAYRVVGEDGHPVEGADLKFTATAAGGAGGDAPATTAATPGGAPVAREQTGAAATANEQPLKEDQEDAEAAEDDGGSGTVLWVLVGAGALAGIGIGVAIVYRAKRRHGVAGAGE
ncbi:copper resistance CopC family protein [Actinomadura fibrosa]|uniref:Copper resistance protein CopC n=1 Tax=Actinomadura fibrosa TaxID=111802 RepID=A0ABW2XJT2_9ACTN|nr:copper resistance protein CopC [Actinomadura fibrosa]